MHRSAGSCHSSQEVMVPLREVGWVHLTWWCNELTSHPLFPSSFLPLFPPSQSGIFVVLRAMADWLTLVTPS